MAGLLLSTTLIDQNFGQAVVDLADALAKCRGIAALIADTDRLPPGGSAGLVAKGYDQATADLYVATFTDLNNLYRAAHGIVGPTDFFANAKKLMGTVPMP